MNSQYTDKAIKGLIAVFIFLSLFLVVKTIAELDTISSEEPYYNSISITGEGEVIAIPDIATFSFTVTESSETVDTAQTMATTKINKALDALKANGVAEADLKTQGYNIYPKYEWQTGICYMGSCPNGENKLIGYEVSQTIQVKIRDTKKAGELLTLVGAQGISNASGLSFTIDDQDALEDSARSKAIENAKEKAKQLAKDLHVDLGDVVGYYEENQGGYPMYDYGMGASMNMKAEAMAAPQLPVGENTIVSRVTVTFEIDN